MTKPLEISHSNWEKIKPELFKGHPPSVRLIREKRKKVLGFTEREFSEWCPTTREYKHCMMLDFYSEKKRTFFILKYGDYLIND